MDKELIKGIIIENDQMLLNKYQASFSSRFDISIFNDMSSALPYIVENNINLYFYVVKYSKEEKENILYFTDKIKEINPQIKLVITNASEDFNSDTHPNALVFAKNTDAGQIVDSIYNVVSKIHENDSSKKRQYSRVNWPLNVIIAYKDKIRGTIDRNILSISGNGAYISSDTNIPEKGDVLGLTISFKDFKLFTEAKVVWVNNENQKPNLPRGFAVQFIEIGMASQKIIDQIIRDKLLQEILVDMKDDKFAS